MEAYSNTRKQAKATISIAAAIEAQQREDAQSSQPIHVPLLWAKHDKLAVLVSDVLSEEECDAIIQSCEVHGFEQALLNIGGCRQVLATSIRKSERCIIDDVHAADILWERLHQAAPNTIEHGGRSWQCVGLNERFRVLKYQPGDYFMRHSDGVFVRPKGADTCTAVGEPGDMSFFTVMLYLNTPAKGGGTDFINSADSSQVSHVAPCTGQALVFDHSIPHEGAMLEAGVKYAIRTDVMYRCVDSTEPAMGTATGVAAATGVFIPTKHAPHGYTMKC
eukprot:CAMPEP_0172303054 /NCGR_PEP_ID=MMETSP1058-20130122/4642_1 /TAXON_ID=83371 /ORGANISM="Detonula confervacea, Strain CCMP 353" /LENGTH=276 /DNA_ID=CAMNT_0013013733 /DNA_START=53 /DNA_END=883 /DNA_ORIENTATION=-